MGQAESKASEVQKNNTTAALSKMCEDVAKAVVEVAKLVNTWEEDPSVIMAAAKKVQEICEKQIKITTGGFLKELHLKKMLRSSASERAMGSGSHDIDALRMKLLFLDLLKSALESDGEETGSQNVIADSWTKQRTLGQGAFGTVYAAVDKNGLQFAVKEVPRHGMQEKLLRDEVKTLRKLSHENIIKLYGCAGDNEKYYMYMELMEGSVRDQIEKTGPIQESIAKKYTKDLLKGLIYLHQNDVIHCDIKCANLLLDARGTTKLADMGISKVYDKEYSEQPAQNIAGCLPWMSPEVLNKQEPGKRSDVWSVGCAIFEMVKGNPPFLEDMPQALLGLWIPMKILALEHKKLVSEEDDFSPALQSFLMRIFVKKETRPYAEDIADHPWAR